MSEVVMYFLSEKYFLSAPDLIESFINNYIKNKDKHNYNLSIVINIDIV